MKHPIILPLLVFIFILHSISVKSQDDKIDYVDSMLINAKQRLSGVELLDYVIDSVKRERRASRKAYLARKDEFLELANKYGTDSSVYVIYESMSEAHVYGQEYEMADSLITMAHHVALNSNDVELTCRSLLMRSSISMRAGNYKQAIEYAQQAKPYAEVVKEEHPILLFNTYEVLGGTYLYMGYPKLGITQLHKALEVADGIPDMGMQLFGLLINMGVSKTIIEDYPGAIAIFQKAWSSYKEEYPILYKSYILSNMSQAFMEDGQLDSARYYVEQLIPLVGYDREIPNTYYTLSANIYRRQDSLSLARHHAQLAVNAAKEINNDHSLGTSLAAQGQVEVQLGNYIIADVLFNKAEKKLVSVGATDQLKGLREAQLDNYLSQHSKKAKDLFVEYQVLTDSIENTEVKQAVAEIETKYQTRIRQDSIANLTLRSQAAESTATSRQRQLWLLLALLAAVGGGLFFAIRESRRRKALNDELGQKNARITLLNSDINHRTSHYLTSIIKLLREQKYKMEEAGVATGIVVALERQTLVYTKLQGLLKTVDDRTVVELGDYLGKLTEMLQESFQGAGDPLQLQLQVDTVSVDPSVAAPLALILNELLTNTVKYAKRRGGIIHASFRCEQIKDGELLVNYEDDGLDAELDTSGRFSSNSGLEIIEGLTHQLEADREHVKGYGYRARIEL